VLSFTGILHGINSRGASVTEMRHWSQSTAPTTPMCAGPVRVQVDGNGRDRSIDDAGIDPEHELRGDDDRHPRRDEPTATATI
jgi:hypothetical protein